MPRLPVPWSLHLPRPIVLAMLVLVLAAAVFCPGPGVHAAAAAAVPERAAAGEAAEAAVGAGAAAARESGASPVQRRGASSAGSGRGRAGSRRQHHRAYSVSFKPFRADTVPMHEAAAVDDPHSVLMTSAEGQQFRCVLPVLDDDDDFDDDDDDGGDGEGDQQGDSNARRDDLGDDDVSEDSADPGAGYPDRVNGSAVGGKARAKQCDSQATCVAAAEQLLSKLARTNEKCLYRTVDWWTYELCHQRRARQFHVGEQSPDVPNEYDIGTWNPEHADFVSEIRQQNGAAWQPRSLAENVEEAAAESYAASETVLNAPPPIPGQPERRLVVDEDGNEYYEEGDEYLLEEDIEDRDAYKIALARSEKITGSADGPGDRHELLELVQSYHGGTPCDVATRQRKTEVIWRCNPDARTSMMVDASEPISCMYRVVIHTPLLCSHSLFRPATQPIEPILCYPLQQAPAHQLRLITDPSSKLDSGALRELLAELVSSGQVAGDAPIIVVDGDARQWLDSAQQDGAMPEIKDEALRRIVQEFARRRGHAPGSADQQTVDPAGPGHSVFQPVPGSPRETQAHDDGIESDEE